METGRVIHGRYQLQRLVKQTPFCIVYQGIDQRLQRAVAVKSVLAPHVAAYKAAVKVTANFSHPYIIGLYDLVIEPEALYVVQEYVEGDAFETLVQKRLSAFEIAQIGWQMCLALMYAGSSTRRVCHGDLVPAAVLRDHHGAIRINNFALPDDRAYFQKWSALGAEGVPLLEPELPSGQQSEARKADDTRAVGLLLYQLLTDALEPPAELPADGRLRFRFSRGIPPELCDTITRTVVLKHPQNISTPEALYAQLKPLANALEPSLPSPTSIGYQQKESLVRQFSPATAGKVTPALPSRDSERSARSLSTYSGKLAPLEQTPADSAITNPSSNMGGQQMLPQVPPGSKPSSPTLTILLIGLAAFALFFIIGYFLGHALIR